MFFCFLILMRPVFYSVIMQIPYEHRNKWKTKNHSYKNLIETLTEFTFKKSQQSQRASFFLFHQNAETLSYKNTHSN